MNLSAEESAQVARAAADATVDISLDDIEDVPSGTLTAEDPKRVGRYRIARRLGEGHFGVVYEARADGANESVALKVLRQNDARWQVYQRFLRESDALRALDHPNVVRLYEADRDPAAGAYYVMEFVSGGRATDMKREPANLKNLLRVSADLFAALSHLHAHNWVHRDVKPDNILLTVPDAKGAVRGKLCDFGLAKVEDTASSSAMALTRDGEFGGTPAMAAPEQWEQFGRFDPAMDRYSAGATVYRIFTGAVPLTLVQPLEVISLAKLHKAVFELPRIPLAQRCPWAPSELCALVDALVTRDGDFRHRNDTQSIARRLDALAGAQ